MTPTGLPRWLASANLWTFQLLRPVALSAGTRSRVSLHMRDETTAGQAGGVHGVGDVWLLGGLDRLVVLVQDKGVAVEARVLGRARADVALADLALADVVAGDVEHEPVVPAIDKHKTEGGSATDGRRAGEKGSRAGTRAGGGE